MKKITKLLSACFSIFILSACVFMYEDINGDSTELCTISNENIIKMDVGSSGLKYAESKLARSMVSEYSAKNFNGVEQIYFTSFIEKSNVFVYIGHLSVKSGNFKMVVVNNDKIIKEIPNEAFGEEFYFQDVVGDFSIRVAGENANVEFYVDVY